MFERDRFIAECRDAVAADPSHKAAREVIARAVSNPAAVLRGLGEPTRAGIELLYRSTDLTVLNLVWGPGMSVPPHNHTIGIYSGREDSIFWRRTQAPDGRQIEAAGARSMCVGDVDALGRDVVHSVLNPIDRLTGAIHLYGGDFVAAERSEWDPGTLREGRLDLDRTRRRFEASNAALAVG